LNVPVISEIETMTMESTAAARAVSHAADLLAYLDVQCMQSHFQQACIQSWRRCCGAWASSGRRHLNACMQGASTVVRYLRGTWFKTFCVHGFLQATESPMRGGRRAHTRASDIRHGQGRGASSLEIHLCCLADPGFCSSSWPRSIGWWLVRVTL
jgi:hypothetical protein